MKKKKWLPQRWSPIRSEIDLFRRSIDDAFNNFFKAGFPSKLLSGWESRLGKMSLETDMYETAQDVVVEMAVPGCDKKDFKINVDNNILTVSGEKKEEKETKKKNFYQKEQHYGAFQRSVSLPHYADVEKSKADCNKGVLKVTFPKIASSVKKGKRIEIK